MRHQRYSLSVCIWCKDWAHLGPESTVPVHPQPRQFNSQQFLDFRAIVFTKWSFFDHYDSPVTVSVKCHDCHWYGQEPPSPPFRWNLRVNKQETREDIEGNVFHWFEKNHWHLRLSHWRQLTHLVSWPHQSRQWPYCAGAPSLDRVGQKECSWGQLRNEGTPPDFEKWSKIDPATAVLPA